jgi:uncharacterized protein (TIGR03435 family)
MMGADLRSAQAAGRGAKRRRNLGEVAARGESVVRDSLQRRLKTILRGAAAIAVPVGLVVWTARAAHAQSAAPKFEVASVRPWMPGSAVHLGDCSGDRYLVAGVHFGNILQWAYDLQGAAGDKLFLERVPVSLRQKAYEIQAEAADPIASESQCRLMVQALLADRFKLAFHHETRDADLFDLVVARGGPKLQQALPTDEGSDVNFVVDGRLVYTQPPIADPTERAHTKGMTMEELARRLPTTAPAPVADKTGLEGRYKIDLRYSSSLPADNQDTPEDPQLDAALAKLGLRLEKHKGSVKVPVLDHIEPPDSN